jgi:hypothetical protein
MGRQRTAIDAKETRGASHVVTALRSHLTTARGVTRKRKKDEARSKCVGRGRTCNRASSASSSTLQTDEFLPSVAMSLVLDERVPSARVLAAEGMRAAVARLSVWRKNANKVAFVVRTVSHAMTTRMSALVRSKEPSVKRLKAECARLSPCGVAGRARVGVDRTRTSSAIVACQQRDDCEIDGRDSICRISLNFKTSV